VQPKPTASEHVIASAINVRKNAIVVVVVAQVHSDQTHLLSVDELRDRWGFVCRILLALRDTANTLSHWRWKNCVIESEV